MPTGQITFIMTRQWVTQTLVMENKNTQFLQNTPNLQKLKSIYVT